MKFCVVIVTYGKRYHLLNQVIDAIIHCRASKIIIVDNNSDVDTKEKLSIKEKNLSGLLKVIKLQDNTGSAGGYKVGLEYAYSCKDCEFIWLLDDDNIPYDNALEVLIEFWNNYEIQLKEQRLCLLSYRENSPVYIELAKINSTSIDPVIEGPNYFLGFNILKIFSKKNRLFTGKNKKQEVKTNLSNGLIPVAPYGGMFFNKSLIDIIGYPDERLFLYGDDYEFSHRIIKHGGIIMLVLNSRIKDIDISMNKGMEVDKSNLFRLYYSTRNNVFFQKKLSNNSAIFKLNYIIFFLFLFFKKIFVSFYEREKSIKLSIMLFAIRDGFNEKMGKREDRIKSN